MSSRKFRFVSPGVFLREVDNSQMPAVRDAVGPVIIGRTNKGPAFKPYKVRSLEELETVFGKPSPGGSLDPWREGTGLLADTYALHAAKAYLTAGQGTDSPVTMVRVLGIAGDDASTSATHGEPGWTSKSAYGLFVAEETNSNTAAGSIAEMELAGIFYGTHDDFVPKLTGHNVVSDAGDTAGALSTPFRFDANNKIGFKLAASNSRTRLSNLVFTDLRDDFNTNPVTTNDQISNTIAGTLAEDYWLGETFEETFKKFSTSVTAAGSHKVAVLAKLDSGDGAMTDFQSGAGHSATAGRSGWVVHQDTTGDTSTFDLDNQAKLFRVIALHEGSQSSQEIMIGIEDINVPRIGASDPYGSFSVVVRKIVSTGLVEVERFTDCNLNPASPSFVARQIGDQIIEWNRPEKRNKVYGEHPNVSEYIRIEMNQDIVNSPDQARGKVPFGFYGPIRPADVTAQVTLTGAVAEVEKITVKQAVAINDIHEKTLTVVKHGAPIKTVVFEFTNADDLLVFGANPFIGVKTMNTAQKVADQIRAAIVGHSDLAGLSVTVVTASGNDRVLSITQGERGDVVTLAKNMDNTSISISTTTAGVDGTAGTEHALLLATDWLDESAKIELKNFADVGASIKFKYPEMPLINIPRAGTGYRLGVSPFVMSYKATGEATDGTAINAGYVDYLRKMPSFSSLESDQRSGVIQAGKTKYSFKFSLDDVILKKRPGIANVGEIVSSGDVASIEYKPDSFKGTTSGTDKSYSSDTAESLAGTSLRTLLGIVSGFQMPLDGGFDGVNITESDPFNERVLEANSTASSYAFASIDRAIELVKDPEAIEHNLAVMPGISNRTLTRKLVDTCEARADSLAIIDLPDIYLPPSERKKDTFALRIATTPEAAANNLVAEQLNSSYGATYYPWV